MRLFLKLAGYGFVAFLILAALGMWFMISRLSSGYENSGGEVHFRSFSNVNYKIDRKKVEGANSKTFKRISRSGGLYGSDDKTVYFKGIAISNAAPSSFQVLDWRQSLSRDADKVFYGSFQVSDDPNSFQVLRRGYSRDMSNVYFGHSIVEDADPKSFVVTGTVTSEAHDNKHKYNMGRLVSD